MKIYPPKFFAVLLLAAVPACQASSIQYEVINLRQAYGADITSFYGMAQNGDITVGSGAKVARISQGQRTDIPTSLPQGVYEVSRFTNQGVLYYSTADGLYQLSTGGTITDTGYHYSSNHVSIYDTNRVGTVVGNHDVIFNDAFIYDPVNGGRTYHSYGGINVNGFHAVNDAGWLVGTGYGGPLDGSYGGIYLWKDNQTPIRLMADRGYGSAEGINEAGQIVGTNRFGAGFEAYFWEGGTLTRPVHRMVEDPVHPGTFNDAVVQSFAHELDEKGMMTGHAQMRTVPGYLKPVHSLAYRWTEEGGLEWFDDLIDPALNISLSGAGTIADDGSILAGGYLGNSTDLQYYLLRPIPEPATTMLTGFSLALALKRRRARLGV